MLTSYHNLRLAFRIRIVDNALEHKNTEDLCSQAFFNSAVAIALGGRTHKTCWTRSAWFVRSGSLSGRTLFIA